MIPDSSNKTRTILIGCTALIAIVGIVSYSNRTIPKSKDVSIIPNMTAVEQQCVNSLEPLIQSFYNKNSDISQNELKHSTDFLNEPNLAKQEYNEITKEYEWKQLVIRENSDYCQKFSLCFPRLNQIETFNNCYRYGPIIN